MISGASWTNTLYGKLTAMGFRGRRLRELCEAVGMASEGHVVGKPFATADVGQIFNSPPFAPGAGVGITALDGALATSTTFAACQAAFGHAGRRLHDFCEAFGQTLPIEMLTATLTSQHMPVFDGVGTVVVGSIGVSEGPWGSLIESEGRSRQFRGRLWPDFAAAMGKGYATEVLQQGTGTVVIAGSYGGSFPPGPLPGAGAGTGVIT